MSSHTEEHHGAQVSFQPSCAVREVEVRTVVFTRSAPHVLRSALFSRPQAALFASLCNPYYIDYTM